MTSETFLLGDLIEIKHGFAFPGKDFSEDPSFPTLVTPGNFRIGGGFLDSKPKTFSGAIPSDYVLQPEDLIVTMTDLSKAGDTLGYSAKVPSDKTYLHNQRIGKVVNKRTDLLILEYLNWFMRTKSYRTAVMSSATGTTVRHTSPSRILEIPIVLPSLTVQARVSKFLNSLERKIKLNEVISKNLEEIAQTIFKSWFIDFDPVTAKIAGETPLGMEEMTAALFPDSMVESELGLIPSSWEVRTVGSLCGTLLGGTPSRAKEEFWGGSIPWINSGKVNEFRISAPSEFITDEGLLKSATKMLPKGTTVVAITGATLGQFSRLEIEACANQSVVGIIGSDFASNEFIYLNIRNGIKRLVSAQTGGAQQHINKEDVNSFTIVYPGPVLVSSFTDVARDLFTQIGLLAEQNDTLSKTRDSLLPRLVSGELQLPEEMLVS